MNQLKTLLKKLLRFVFPWLYAWLKRKNEERKERDLMIRVFKRVNRSINNIPRIKNETVQEILKRFGTVQTFEDDKTKKSIRTSLRGSYYIEVSLSLNHIDGISLVRISDGCVLWSISSYGSHMFS